MKLHPVVLNHSTRRAWCGLVALSAITGNPTEHSRLFLREILDENTALTGKVRVLKGIYLDEMEQALNKMCLDWKKLPIKIFSLPIFITTISLARFLHFAKPRQDTLWLIRIPRHVLVTDGKIIIDSSYPSGTPIYNYHRLDEEITHCYEISDTSLNNL